MKFNVLCVLNRTVTINDGRQFQNRDVVAQDFDVQSPEQLAVAVAFWLANKMREEPCITTQLLSLSHTQIQ